MKKLLLLFAVSVVLISSAEQCGSGTDVTPTRADAGCFNNAPLTNIGWASDQLAFFQRPKSGPLRVVVYSYKKEPFLAFENGFVSSPSSYIFDCSGRSLGARGIRYNEFYDNSMEVNVLLEGKY